MKNKLKLKVGDMLKIVHSRKGVFYGRYIGDCDGFDQFIIEGGLPEMMNPDNQLFVNDQISIRKTLYECYEMPRKAGDLNSYTAETKASERVLIKYDKEWCFGRFLYGIEEWDIEQYANIDQAKVECWEHLPKQGYQL